MHKNISRLFATASLLVLVGAGCGSATSVNTATTNMPNPQEQQPMPADTSTDAAFGADVEMKASDEVIFPDGLRMKLDQIGDSRCKGDVQCIWEGELSPTLSLTGGTLSGPQQVRLGTVTALTATVEGYEFSLRGAQEDSATIAVRPVVVDATPTAAATAPATP